ncbi:unnamed protein product [Lasius platythorax]|uniref:Uncharacterized protein n=1 Tax=Lasius platythorax TaxID=488582 RepID=A0AAV2MZA2_9HYME
MIFRVRLQEAMVEQNKLNEQLQNFEYKLQLQKNEFNTSIEEKLIEQQRWVSENENLKLRLQTIEKEKCEISLQNSKTNDHFKKRRCKMSDRAK